jgi:hypothetical protein
MLSLHNKFEVDDNPISRSYSCEVLQFRFSFIAADNKLLEVSKFFFQRKGKGVISFIKDGELCVNPLKSLVRTLCTSRYCI